MKRYLLFGAGFNLLLLVLLVTQTLTVSIGQPPFKVLPSPEWLSTAALIIVLTVGLGLWFFQLQTFTKFRLHNIQPKAELVLNGLAQGFGLAGIAAWMQGMIVPDGGFGPSLIYGALAGALVFQLAGWLLAAVNSDSPADDPDPDAELVQTGSVKDYIVLTKPIVLALLLVTTLAAMIVASGGMPSLDLFIWTMLGGALSAGGASALNQYIDRFRDSKMARTKKRPLPEGRLHPNNVILFGTLLCTGGFFTLAIFVNLLSAMLALGGIVYYVIFYSLILKPTTTQNIVIGGGAGAIPPLVGWAAAAGELSMPAFFLFALVFFWTPPHFWALALLKRRDYARAGVPMLPVIHGPDETRWQIMLYTVQVVALTLLLPLASLGGQIYLLTAMLLGGGLVFYAWRLWRQGGNQSAYQMYRYSSTYLALIFAALVVDTFI